MRRTVIAFLAAAAVTYLLAAAFSTQVILHQVAELGMPITLSVRLATTLRDMFGMLPVYLPFVAVSLLIALPISTFALKFVPVTRVLGYVIGGAAALCALHMILFAVLGMHPLPATRLVVGMATQVLAGAVGGYIYATLTGKEGLFLFKGAKKRHQSGT